MSSTRRCSAALVYTFNQISGKAMYLLVKTRSGKEYTFPKGGLEPELTPIENAAKEVREEAGISVSPKGWSLGNYRIFKNRAIQDIEVLAMFTAKPVQVCEPEPGRKPRFYDLDTAIAKAGPHLAPFIVELDSHLTTSWFHERDKRQGKI